MNKLTESSPRDSYMLVRALGAWTTQAARQVIDEAKSEAIARGYTRILFDLTGWEQPDQEMTRFWSGEYLANQMTTPFKVAAFADLRAINKFGERVAVNRFANFRIFPDEVSANRVALGWGHIAKALNEQLLRLTSL